MRKILYACVCNNGGMLRVAEWCERYSQNHNDMVFLILSETPFQENENLKWIPFKEENGVFTKENIEHYTKAIEVSILI